MSLILDNLDNKLMDNFRGFVVKKDLVRQLKIWANVPAFVLEYLLANSCSTTDEEQIRKGIENVKKILQDHYVNPEESKLTQSKIREQRNFTVIDRIEVALDANRDKYWANLLNSNINFVQTIQLHEHNHRQPIHTPYFDICKGWIPQLCARVLLSSVVFRFLD